MKKALAISFILLLAVVSFGQAPVSWTLTSDARGKEAASFKAKLTAAIESPWHLYAVDQPAGGPIPTTITLPEGSPFKISGAISSPKPQTKFDENFKIDTKFFEKEAVFEIPLTASAGAKVDDLTVNVRFQVCNDTTCLPPKTVKVTFAGFESVAGRVQVPMISEPDLASNQAVFPSPATNNQTPTDVWPFIWLAVSLGALSLLTPCVFPMIPITVSYFTNHAAGSRAKSVKLATIYSLGIIATFTIVGMLLAVFVGAAGINLFAANPWINLLITAIFLLFAFNLFGAYELTIPTRVLTKLDSITRSKEGEGSGVLGALLMGLTFTLTSFTCTSPFVGTILVSASQGNWRMPLLGMLAFSAVFALPFFILALIPQWVSQLPRAGGWMNSIKVAMGFLEVAAAMKFISNVDLVWKWGIFTRDVVLAVWIALGVILTLYLLGKFQLSHDSKPERLGAFRMASAVVSLAMSFYLLTGLFGAKLGEIESFLPPDLNNSSSRSFRRAEPEIKWISNDYQAALSNAKAENKNVFVDFTGYTCTNCRWMEANVFPKQEVENEMGNFVLARLYTDGEGDVYARQQQMEQDMFGTVALPFYAIIDGDGKTVATFPGLTRNTSEFVDFLKKGRKN
jgi:thiol:disulfide interchange protein